MHFEIGEDPTEKLVNSMKMSVADNLDYFKISPGYSRGIYEIGAKTKGIDVSVSVFKHQ